MSDQNTQDQNELPDADLEQAAGGYYATDAHFGRPPKPVYEIGDPTIELPTTGVVPPEEAPTRLTR